MPTQKAIKCRKKEDVANNRRSIAVDATEQPPVTEAFVIYEPHGAIPKPQEKPKEKPDKTCSRVYSDDLYGANARSVYRNFMMEPMFKGGIPTGE